MGWRVAWLGVAFVVTTTAAAEAQRRPRTGFLSLVGRHAGAEVFVDAERIGVLPLAAPLELPAGNHTVRITKPGYTELSEVVVIERGQTLELEVDLFPVSMLLTVTTQPPGAEVFVDGEFAGQTPVELDLLEGRRSLRVTRSGYRDLIRTVQAAAGRVDQISLTLERLPPPPPAEELEPEWYETPTTWLLVGGGAAALALGVVVVALATADEESRVAAFCGTGEPCIETQPMW